MIESPAINALTSKGRNAPQLNAARSSQAEATNPLAAIFGDAKDSFRRVEQTSETAGNAGQDWISEQVFILNT
jgi:ATP phosphoribosyltransferase